METGLLLFFMIWGAKAGHIFLKSVDAAGETVFSYHISPYLKLYNLSNPLLTNLHTSSRIIPRKAGK